MTSRAAVIVLSLSLGPAWAQAPSQGPREEALLDAVLLGNPEKVKQLLDQGASPEAKNQENDRTALFFAAEKGNAEIVRLLLDHGANLNAVEKEHRERPLGAAARRGHPEVVRLLLAKDDSPSAPATVALNAVYQNNPAVLEAAIATRRLTPEDLSLALELAERQGSSEVAAHLRQAGVPPIVPGPTPTALAQFPGVYRSESGSLTLTVSLKDGSLYSAVGTWEPIRLAPIDPTYFTAAEGSVAFRLKFEMEDGRVVGVQSRYIGETGSFKRIASPDR
jgi:Ankyrin repeats (3 copies)